MKTLKTTVVLTLLAALVGFALTSRADDQKTEKPKPYPLDTCLVCDMKLGSCDMNMNTNSMAAPYYSFVYKGQEIRVCDTSEQAEFEKHAAKYMKKLADEEAKFKK